MYEVKTYTNSETYIVEEYIPVDENPEPMHFRAEFLDPMVPGTDFKYCGLMKIMTPMPGPVPMAALEDFRFPIVGADTLAQAFEMMPDALREVKGKLRDIAEKPKIEVASNVSM